MGYRVYVRSEPREGERRILGEIDTWVKLDFTLRFNAAGTWQLLVKSGTYQADLLMQGRGIVIYQDGVTEPVFSGQIDAFERYWTVDQHTAAGSVFVGGKCDNDLPYGFLAFPATTGTGTEQVVLPLAQQYAGQATRPTGGPLGQLLWNEADMAFGSRALPDRRAGGLVVGVNTPVGPATPDTLRFDNLGSQYETWLKNKRVGYRFVWSPASKKVELRIFECRDLSGSVRFSRDLGNLKQFEWQLKAPTVTRAIVACQGEGSDRYLYQQVDAEGERQWAILREQLVDRRDIPLKTGRDGKPELIVKKNADGTEDLGAGPDGKEWTPGLTEAKAAVAAAAKAVADAEEKMRTATTDQEKAAAATALSQAKALEAAAQSGVAAAIPAAKEAALAHYVKAVEDAAAQALKQGEKSGHFQIYPIDTEQCKFGRDYFVGDVVTVAADGQEYQEVVKEVNISVEDGGRVQSVTPKIGDQGTGEPLNLYRTVWEMKEKLRRLESRM
ncbi:Gp37-like protein [Streptomyces syringium]|uniref:Gp37-like protein n=1 Tax=Streptomyces syringium TaxID=76729 RepID=UPI0033C5D2C5